MAIIKVVAKPNSSESKVQEYKDDKLWIKVSAKPIKGRANKELVKIISLFFNVNKFDVNIKSGKTKKYKLVEIKNKTKEEVKEWIIKKL
jgi:hypothetical protein